MALNAQIQLSILAHETSSGDISRTLRATPVSYALSLADGTGANQAQVVWSDSRSVVAGSGEVVPMNSLSDDRGVVTITSLKAVYIKSTSASGLSLSSTGIGIIRVHSGGAAVVVAPTASGIDSQTSSPVDYRSLTVNPIDGSVAMTYDIVLIGEGSVA